MNIADLAKKLDVTQKAIKEAAGVLKLGLKATAKTLTDEQAKAVTKHLQPVKEEPKKEVVKEKKETKKTKAPEKIEMELDPLMPSTEVEHLEGTEAVIEEVERDLEREVIREQQRKKLASSKQAEKEKLEQREKAKAEQAALLQAKAVGMIGLPGVISVKEFAEKISIPANRVIAELMKNGLIVTINHKIDFDTAEIVASTFGINVTKEREAFSSSDLMLGNIEQLLKDEDKSKMTQRPPIISIMGHVDHGKTKLLDYIRQANVIATEAGGITQRIGAYQVVYKEKPITFLDTPGHEAFTAMRARGAKATDIAILVVAADEGVKPQTKEAYEHIKEANIPVIVALNKIDKPGINMEIVQKQLSEIGLIPEEWGGTTIMVPVSAMTGKGVEQLLDMILLVSDMQQFKANEHRPAIGTVIESNLDPNFGPIATVLINTGTLRLMDFVVVGEAYGRVKLMLAHNFEKLKEAPPSTPVQIAGFSEVPSVGDILQVEATLDAAKDKALQIKTLRRNAQFKNPMGSGMSDLIAKIHAGQLKTLKIVLKADTKGSLEAIRAAIDNIHSTEVEAKVIHSNVGNITETDVLMAAASGGGIVMGFNIQISSQVEKTAARENVEVRSYRVIYQLLDDIKKILLGLLDPEIKEVVLGDLSILAVFLKDKKGMIVGGRVGKGKIEQNGQVRIIRKDKLIGEGVLTSLQRDKERVSSVQEGYECGCRYEGKGEIEVGDILEVYKIEKIKKESL